MAMTTHPRGAEMQRGGERRDLPHRSVHVIVGTDAHGREYEGNRR